MVRAQLLAGSVAVERDPGGCDDGINGGLDAGNLARKTIQGTEDPGRSKEDSVKRKQAELKPSFLWEGTTILIWHGSGELDLRARAVVPSAWMIPLVDDRLERTP